METTAQTNSLSTLRAVSIFTDLAPEELEFVASRARPIQFTANQIIFSEGDPCAGLWIVQSGRVRVFKASPNGREQVLAVDGPGSSVAEIPVFDGGKYPASGMAACESTLLFISRADFHALCMKHPEVALKVLRAVGRRLRGLVGIVEELSFTTVRQRLIALLIRMAQTNGKTRGAAEITLEVSNQELASQIGTVRELISRNLSRLHAEGLIRVEGRKVAIPNLNTLQSELDSPE